jgi:hypothetical protein
MQTSNWPHGTDLGHPNFTGRFPRISRFDGVGGFAANSTKIPFADALMYVGGTVAVVLATLRVAFWLWG